MIESSRQRRTQHDASEASEAARPWWDRVLSFPFIGFVPWIVLGVVEGRGRLTWAIGLALVLAAVVVAGDLLRGRQLKSLALFDVVAFSIFLAATVSAGPALLAWFEVWFGELTNIALTLLVVGSMLARRPFTLEYAKEQAPPEWWDAPPFLRVNYVITGVWGAAFVVASAAGFYGDAVLRDNGNLWTGWIIQVGASVVAGQFTAWYPSYATARNLRAAGLPADDAPPVRTFLATLALDTAVLGLLMLVLHGGPAWAGAALLVLGIIGTVSWRRRPTSGQQQP